MDERETEIKQWEKERNIMDLPSIADVLKSKQSYIFCKKKQKQSYIFGPKKQIDI